MLAAWGWNACAQTADAQDLAAFGIQAAPAPQAAADPLAALIASEQSGSAASSGASGDRTGGTVPATAGEPAAAPGGGSAADTASPVAAAPAGPGTQQEAKPGDAAGSTLPAPPPPATWANAGLSD
ncbi:hypothetical protein P3W85_18160, partial [Cupriavidus basilensis]|nr:hypothetical protein [Cupriavidus basilensis]